MMELKHNIPGIVAALSWCQGHLSSCKRSKQICQGAQTNLPNGSSEILPAPHGLADVRRLHFDYAMRACNILVWTFGVPVQIFTNQGAVLNLLFVGVIILLWKAEFLSSPKTRDALTFAINVTNGLMPCLTSSATQWLFNSQIRVVVRLYFGILMHDVRKSVPLTVLVSALGMARSYFALQDLECAQEVKDSALRTAIFAEITVAGFFSLCFVTIDWILEYAISLKTTLADVQQYSQSVENLLAGFCDAHVILEHSNKILKTSPSFNNMLLAGFGSKSDGTNMMGRNFLDFVRQSDQTPFENFMTSIDVAFDPEVKQLSQSVIVNLRDSAGLFFEAEIFSAAIVNTKDRSPPFKILGIKMRQDDCFPHGTSDSKSSGTPDRSNHVSSGSNFLPLKPQQVRPCTQSKIDKAGVVTLKSLTSLDADRFRNTQVPTKTSRQPMDISSAGSETGQSEHVEMRQESQMKQLVFRFGVMTSGFPVESVEILFDSQSTEVRRLKDWMSKRSWRQLQKNFASLVAVVADGSDSPPVFSSKGHSWANQQFNCLLWHQQWPSRQQLLLLIGVISGAAENAVVPNYGKGPTLFDGFGITASNGLSLEAKHVTLEAVQGANGESQAKATFRDFTA